MNGGPFAYVYCHEKNAEKRRRMDLASASLIVL